MKMKIEVECPDGYKPVYEDGVIKFEKAYMTYGMAINKLDFKEAERLRYRQECLIQLLTIIRALNKEVVFEENKAFGNLNGRLYYPNFHVRKGKTINAIHLEKGRETYYLANKGAAIRQEDFHMHYCDMDSPNIESSICLLSCYTKEIAEYVAKTYPKLIYEALFSCNDDTKWLDDIK
jgi:excinuclease UvrABC nuclease subunit